MNTRTLQPGDLVLCDVRGRTFRAELRERLEDRFRVSPIDSGVTYFHVTARQIRERICKAGRLVEVGAVASESLRRVATPDVGGGADLDQPTLFDLGTGDPTLSGVDARCARIPAGSAWPGAQVDQEAR